MALPIQGLAVRPVLKKERSRKANGRGRRPALRGVWSTKFRAPTGNPAPEDDGTDGEGANEPRAAMLWAAVTCAAGAVSAVGSGAAEGVRSAGGGGRGG